MLTTTAGRGIEGLLKVCLLRLRLSQVRTGSNSDLLALLGLMVLEQ